MLVITAVVAETGYGGTIPIIETAHPYSSSGSGTLTPCDVLAFLVTMSLTTTKARELIRGVREGSAELSLGLARALTLEVVRSYWTRFSDGAALPREVEAFGVEVEAAPWGMLEGLQILGRQLVEVPPLDASFVVGRVYMALLPKAYRARHGIYFTPPPLARRLLDLVRHAGVDLAGAQVLDPACGGGAFLAPVVSAKIAALKDRSSEEALDRVAGSVRGFEIDPFGAWLSQVFVDAVSLPLVRAAGVELPMLVEVRDALEAGEVADFDVVIGNPPYGRAVLARGVRERFARSVYGHANLYGLFTDLALRLARPGGVIAFVTPTSFLAGQYFKNLRSLLAAEAPPEALEFVSDREGVFDDVLQETLLAVYRREQAARPGRARLLRVQPEGGLDVEDVGEFILPERATDPWVIPRDRRQVSLVRAARRRATRLRDLGYRVSTGPLVWNRHKQQLRREPGPGRFPLIWAEAVTADGRFEFRAERRNHEPYFEVEPGRDDWLLIRAPCVLLQRTTAKEQPRRLIAAELPPAFLQEHGAAVVENHLNMIYAAPAARVPARVIVALFRSRVIDDLFRCLNGSVAVSAFELEALALPELEALDRLEALLDAGASDAEIDALLEDAYRDDVAAAA